MAFLASFQRDFKKGLFLPVKPAKTHLNFVTAHPLPVGEPGWGCLLRQPSNF
jgi:hypothetical protein